MKLPFANACGDIVADHRGIKPALEKTAAEADWPAGPEGGYHRFPMSPLLPVDIFSRWVHVSVAAILTGGVFFYAILLPAAARPLELTQRDALLLRARRALKMTVHSAILLLLLTGAYNAVRNWHTYNQRPGITHGLFGIHLLLALAVMAVLLVQLSGQIPKPAQLSNLRWAVALLLLAIAAASTLKSAREWAHDHPRPTRNQPLTSQINSQGDSAVGAISSDHA